MNLHSYSQFIKFSIWSHKTSSLKHESFTNPCHHVVKWGEAHVYELNTFIRYWNIFTVHPSSLRSRRHVLREAGNRYICTAKLLTDWPAQCGAVLKTRSYNTLQLESDDWVGNNFIYWTEFSTSCSQYIHRVHAFLSIRPHPLLYITSLCG